MFHYSNVKNVELILRNVRCKTADVFSMHFIKELFWKIYHVTYHK